MKKIIKILRIVNEDRKMGKYKSLAPKMGVVDFYKAFRYYWREYDQMKTGFIPAYYRIKENRE